MGAGRGAKAGRETGRVSFAPFRKVNLWAKIQRSNGRYVMGSSYGALKAAARRIGITPSDYINCVESGLKWCTSCKDWHARLAFPADASRRDGLAASCRSGRIKRYKLHYRPKPGPRKYGPNPKPPEDGNRRQARQRINVEVRTGRRPRPNLLPCVDCGHKWAAGERRHEYDHYLGYNAAHHYDVESVCTICHRRRMAERKEIEQQRDNKGRYARKTRKEAVTHG